MMKKIYWVAALLLAIQTFSGTPEASASARTTKKIGVSFGIASEPYPSVFVVNANYNLNHFLRIGAGYGSTSIAGAEVTTLGANLKIFPFDINFAPYASLGYSNMTGTITGTSVTSIALGSGVNYGFGIDWQTYLGFNLGLCYNMTTIATIAINAPGIYLGWYF